MNTDLQANARVEADYTFFLTPQAWSISGIRDEPKQLLEVVMAAYSAHLENPEAGQLDFQHCPSPTSRRNAQPGKLALKLEVMRAGNGKKCLCVSLKGE